MGWQGGGGWGRRKNKQHMSEQHELQRGNRFSHWLDVNDEMAVRHRDT